MANRFLNNIKINDSYTLPPADGTADQIIKTNGTGQLSFVDQGDIVVGEADKAKSVTLRVKNSTASAMSKGQVVCEAVSATPPSGNLIEVALADNNGVNTMPALGILNEDLDAAGGANDEGDAIMFGKVSGIDTSAFSVGDEVFVDDTPGGLTTTKPTGVKYIQKVGVVIRDDASNGTIEVFGAGRVNDVPTPLYIDHANQRLGIGTTSPSEKLHIDGGDVFVTTNSSINQYKWQYGTQQVWSIGGGNYFTIKGGSTRFVTLNSAGNFGIGTTSPDYVLHVDPTVKIGDRQGTDGSLILQSQQGPNITLTSSGNNLNISGATGSSNGNTISLKDSIKLFEFDPNIGGTIKIRRGNRGLMDTSFGGFVVEQQTTTSSNGRSTFLSTDTNGTILRSTSYGGTGTSADIQFQFGGGNNASEPAPATKMIIKNSGNVGIGTTSPTHKLQVVGNGAFNSTLDVQDPAVSDNGLLRLSHDSTGSSLYSNPASSNVSTVVLRLGINNSEKMRIANNGNIGIGTTAPSTKLHLQGGIARFDNVSSNYLEIDGSDSNNNHAIISNRFNQLQLKTNTGAGDPHIALLPATSGNVGIGTASPADKLHVGSGAIRLDNNYQLRWGGTGTGIYGHSSQGLNLYTNSGSTRLKIDNGGNVGIGTTSPSHKLTINASNNTTALGIDFPSAHFDFSANSTSGYTSNFRINDVGMDIGHDSTARSLNLQTGNLDRLTILGNGNVGIGTINPSEKLEVSGGNIKGDGLIQVENSSDNNIIGKLVVDYGSGNNPTLTSVGGSEIAVNANLVMRSNNGIYSDTSSSTGLIIGSERADTPIKFLTSPATNATYSEAMRIAGDGNVGIGTTSPSEKLEVVGNIISTFTAVGTPALITSEYSSSNVAELESNMSGGKVVGTSEGGGFVISSYGDSHINSGNVGIGTTSPAGRLELNGSGQSWSTAPGIRMWDSFNSKGWFVGSANNVTAGDFYIRTLPGEDTNPGSSQQEFTIKHATGNVGIGTTSPGAKLEVSGTVKSSGLDVDGQGNSATNFLQYTRTDSSQPASISYDGTGGFDFNLNGGVVKFSDANSGAVGIGITTPAPGVKLHIGSASSSGSTTEEFRIQTGTGSGYGGNAVVNLNTGAFGKSGIYFGNNGSLSYANQDSFLEYNDYSGETKLNFGNTLTINKGTSSAIYINSNANVGIGTTSPSYQLQLSTNSAAKPTSSSWTVVSDERVKTNIRPYETGLQELLQIEPKLFDYNGKAGFDATVKNNIGVIAQEIKDVMPETVKKYNAKLNEEDEENTELYNFDSHALTFALINSVKELNAKIESLESRIQTLENQ